MSQFLQHLRSTSGGDVRSAILNSIKAVWWNKRSLDFVIIANAIVLMFLALVVNMKEYFPVGLGFVCLNVAISARIMTLEIYEKISRNIEQQLTSSQEDS